MPIGNIDDFREAVKMMPQKLAHTLIALRAMSLEEDVGEGAESLFKTMKIALDLLLRVAIRENCYDLIDNIKKAIELVGNSIQDFIKNMDNEMAQDKQHPLVVEMLEGFLHGGHHEEVIISDEGDAWSIAIVKQ